MVLNRLLLSKCCLSVIQGHNLYVKVSIDPLLETHIVTIIKICISDVSHSYYKQLCIQGVTQDIDLEINFLTFTKAFTYVKVVLSLRYLDKAMHLIPRVIIFQDGGILFD